MPATRECSHVLNIPRIPHVATSFLPPGRGPDSPFSLWWHQHRRAKILHSFSMRGFLAPHWPLMTPQGKGRDGYWGGGGGRPVSPWCVLWYQSGGNPGAPCYSLLKGKDQLPISLSRWEWGWSHISFSGYLSIFFLLRLPFFFFDPWARENRFLLGHLSVHLLVLLGFWLLWLPVWVVGCKTKPQGNHHHIVLEPRDLCCSASFSWLSSLRLLVSS